MEQKQNPNKIKSFWPLVLIFVLAALVGGVIIGVAYGNILQDEISSYSFKVHNFKKQPANSISPTTTTATKITK